MRRVELDGMRKLYRFAFDQICDPADWKAPIQADVPNELAEFYCKAVQFMTATRPTLRLCATVGSVLLESPGYRAGPAGDH